MQKNNLTCRQFLIIIFINIQSIASKLFIKTAKFDTHVQVCHQLHVSVPLSRPYTDNFCHWQQGNIIVCACCLWNISWYIHFTSHLEIDRRSILKQLVERSIQYFHVQHPRTIILPCCQLQKLPLYGWSANVPWYMAQNTTFVSCKPTYCKYYQL